MNILEVLKFIMPFSNEIANALTISKEGEFKRIYKACPGSWQEMEIKTVIDVIALTAICWNVADVSYYDGVKKGLLIGIMLIIVAFIMPNLFMEPFVNNICDTRDDDITDNDPESPSNKCNHFMRFVLAIVFIVILFICEYFGHKFIHGLKVSKNL